MCKKAKKEGLVGLEPTMQDLFQKHKLATVCKVNPSACQALGLMEEKSV